MKKWGKIFGIAILLMVLVTEKVWAWTQFTPTSDGGYISTDGYYTAGSGGIQGGSGANVCTGCAGSGGLGQLWGNGQIGGFYRVNYNQQGAACPAGLICMHPIGTGIPGDGPRAGVGKTCKSTNLSCAEDLNPDFSGTTHLVCGQCVGIGTNYNQTIYTGNRVKQGNSSNPPVGSCFYGGAASDQYITYTVTDKCIPKCEAGTTYTPKRTSVGCVNYDTCARNGGINLGGGGCKGNNWNCGRFMGAYDCKLNSDAVKGRVYFDQGNNCSVATPWNLGQGLNITLTNGTNSYTTNVLSSNLVEEAGKYVASAPTGTYTMSLTGIPAGYECSTKCGGCPARNGIKSPSSAGNDFFVAKSKTSEPWWQVVDSDVQSLKDLVSAIPPSQVFDSIGAGGYSGVPAYTTSTGLTGTTVSTFGWLAQSPMTKPKVFDYHYFANQMPADTTISTLTSNTLDQTAIDARECFLSPICHRRFAPR